MASNHTMSAASHLENISQIISSLEHDNCVLMDSKQRLELSVSNLDQELCVANDHVARLKSELEAARLEQESLREEYKSQLNLVKLIKAKNNKLKVEHYKMGIELEEFRFKYDISSDNSQGSSEDDCTNNLHTILEEDVDFDMTRTPLGAYAKRRLRKRSPLGGEEIPEELRQAQELPLVKLTIENLELCVEQYETSLQHLQAKWGSAWHGSTSRATQFARVKNVYDILVEQEQRRHISREEACSLIGCYFDQSSEFKLYQMNSETTRRLVRQHLITSTVGTRTP